MGGGQTNDDVVVTHVSMTMSLTKKNVSGQGVDFRTGISRAGQCCEIRAVL